MGRPTDFPAAGPATEGEVGSERASSPPPSAHPAPVNPCPPLLCVPWGTCALPLLQIRWVTDGRGTQGRGRVQDFFEPDFWPPFFDAFGVLAIFAARSFDIPFFRRP